MTNKRGQKQSDVITFGVIFGILLLIFAGFGIIDLGLTLNSFLGGIAPSYETFDDGAIGEDMFCEDLGTGPGEISRRRCVTDKFIAVDAPSTTVDKVAEWRVENGVLILDTKSSAGGKRQDTVSFTTNQNLKGNDIRVVFERVEDSTFNIGVRGTDCQFSDRGPAGEFRRGPGTIPRSDQTHVFELFSSVLNPNEFRCVLDGTKEAFGTLSDDEPLVLEFSQNAGKTGSGLTKIDRILARPQFESCSLEPGDSVAVEAFRGGQEINQFSTKFRVAKWCSNIPAVITKPTGQESTNEIYDRLRVGQTLTVPNDQVWTVRYVFDNRDVNGNPLTATSCDVVKEDIDVKENECVPRGGVIFIADEGSIVDANTGEIVTEIPSEVPEEVAKAVEEKDCEGFFLKQGDEITCIVDISPDQVCEPNTFRTAEGTCEAKQRSCPSGFRRSEVDANRFTCVPIKVSQTEVAVAKTQEAAKETFRDVGPLAGLLIIAGLALLIFALFRERR